MKKLIIGAVLAASILTTGSFANNNTVTTKGVNCDNGTKGFEVTVSKEGVNKKVYYNSCSTYNGEDGGKLLVISNNSLTFKLVTEELQYDTSGGGMNVYSLSLSSTALLDELNIDLITSPDEDFLITDSEGTELGSIAVDEGNDELVFLYSNPENKSMFINEKEVSFSVVDNKLETKIY